MAKYEAALENLNKSLEIKIWVLGHEHPHVVDTQVLQILASFFKKHVFVCSD